MLTWVKSAPMNACSIPIQTVIGTKSCWFGFLHWFIVADNNATPDNSFADSEPLRFSPYLCMRRRFTISKEFEVVELFIVFGI